MTAHFCETCPHWQPLPTRVPRVNREVGRIEQVVMGHCHRLPPTADHTWPKTLPTAFCGEHPGYAPAPATPAPSPAKPAKAGKGKADATPAKEAAQEPLLSPA